MEWEGTSLPLDIVFFLPHNPRKCNCLQKVLYSVSEEQTTEPREGELYSVVLYLTRIISPTFIRAEKAIDRCGYIICKNRLETRKTFGLILLRGIVADLLLGCNLCVLMILQFLNDLSKYFKAWWIYFRFVMWRKKVAFTKRIFPTWHRMAKPTQDDFHRFFTYVYFFKTCKKIREKFFW